MWYGDDTLEDIVLNRVIVLLYVFHLNIVLNSVRFLVIKMYICIGSLVVIVLMYRCLRNNTQLLKKRLKPYHLTSRVCHGMIFCLCTRVGNNLFSLESTI